MIVQVTNLPETIIGRGGRKATKAAGGVRVYGVLLIDFLIAVVADVIHGEEETIS